jgi:hypothetical protein
VWKRDICKRIYILLRSVEVQRKRFVFDSHTCFYLYDFKVAIIVGCRATFTNKPPESANMKNVE